MKKELVRIWFIDFGDDGNSFNVVAKNIQDAINKAMKDCAAEEIEDIINIEELARAEEE